MDSIEDLLDKISTNNFDVGSEHWVDITHINNPHSFYVRPTVYRAYLSILHAYDEDQPWPTKLQHGSIVIYKSEKFKSYVRGRVMSLAIENDGNGSCDLFALDYGCFETSIPLEDIRKTRHSTDIPPLAIHCQLADCKPIKENWCKEAVESMKFFIGNERAKMLIREKTPISYTVELYNSCPDDIATLLAYDGHTVLGYGDNMISRFTVIESEKHFYNFKQYEVGDTLTVRVQTGDSLKSFFVAQVDDYQCYLNERENFTYFCKNRKSLQPEDIKEGMAVGVLIITSNTYERALVVAITVPDEKVKVMLVDWGKFLEVPMCRLKSMVEKYFLYPASAILCSAEESQLWDNELHKCLYPGYKLNLTIVQLGEQYESPHIVNISPIL